MSALRFLCDENIPRDLGRIAQSEGVEVTFLVDVSRGESDERVLTRALHESRIFITEDGDFGRLIFSDRLASKGVVPLRVAPGKGELRHQRFRRLLRDDAHRLAWHFTVLQERTIRFRPMSHVRPG